MISPSARELAHGRLEMLGLARADGDARAELQELDGGGAADAGAAAGHDGGAPFMSPAENGFLRASSTGSMRAP